MAESKTTADGPMVPLYLVLGPSLSVGIVAAGSHGSGMAVFGAAIVALIWLFVEGIRRCL